jgi:protein phosphatase-4 regulatory subunit 3
LKILYDTMPRDNLLNSACLELFEFVRRENVKMIVQHLVETYREKLQAITYVDTFQNLILKYDQNHEPVTTQELDNSFTSVDSDTPARHPTAVNGGKWGQGLKVLQHIRRRRRPHPSNWQTCPEWSVSSTTSCQLPRRRCRR